MSNLRKDLIHLAAQKPELQPHILPLLRKTAGLKGWKKGQVPVAMTGDVDFMAYQPGITFGVWGIAKNEKADAWAVTHIPSGMAAYRPKNSKVAKAFVEALLAIEPALAYVRNSTELTSTYRSVFAQLIRSSPDTWPEMDSTAKLANKTFLYEGKLPLKTLQMVQVPLTRGEQELLSDLVADPRGKVPSKKYSKITKLGLVMVELVQVRGAWITITDAGVVAQKMGTWPQQQYV